VTSERTFPSTPQSIVRARRFAAEKLAGIDHELADSIAVMVSELVTNSVRHAASEFTVAIERDDEHIRVAVSDLGEQRPSLRNPEPTEQSGRGLQIVNALSDDWGVAATPGRTGKTVWFVVELRPQHGVAAAGDSDEPHSMSLRPDATGGDAPRTRGAERLQGRSRRRHESRAGRGVRCGV
jgi:anti-sigma regulatory factor (Ser/Thr protein kinase)